MKFKSKFLFKNFINHFNQKIVLPNGYTPAKPIQFNIIPTYKCNCRCKMCSFYKNRTEDMKYGDIKVGLSNIKKWMIDPFFINISGGVPLVYKNIYDLLQFCRNNEIYANLTTNGYLLTKENCDKLIEANLAYLNISIDSLSPGVHNEIRRKKGLLERALSGIDYLSSNNVIIGINTVISNKNIQELEDFTIKMFEDYKISRLIFQPITPTFGEKISINEFIETSDFWIRDMQLLDNSLIKLIGLKNRYNILNSKQDIKNYYSYFKNPLKETNKINKCRVGTQNFFIDVNGDIRFCWPFNPIGNIFSHGFEASKVWNSQEARKTRLKALNCKMNCTSRCHTSFSLYQKIKLYFSLRHKSS